MVKKCICGSAVIMHEGKTLLMKHKKLGVWLNPGGHLKENETPDEAAIREVKEETGLDVEIIDIKSNKIKTEIAYETYMPFTIMYEYVNYKEDKHEHFDMIYLVKPKNIADIKPDYGELTEIDWFSEDEINSLEIYENTKTILHNAFEKIK